MPYRKEEYLHKALKTARQLGMTLAAKRKFHEAVKLIREGLDIPPEGVNAGEPARVWQVEFRRKSELWMKQNWPAWRAKILKLQEAGKIVEADKLNKEFNDVVPLNKFDLDIKKLLVKCRLGPNWYEGVRRYIITNDVKLLTPKIAPAVRTKISEFDQLEEISIVIDKATTLKDIELLWPMVEAIQEGLPDEAPLRRRESKQLEHGLLAVAMRDKNKPYDKIAKTLNKKFKLTGEAIYDKANIPDLLKNTRRKLNK